MGSEDVEVQCHQPQVPVSDSCDSSTAVGIATIPYQLADPPPMSIAQNHAGTPSPAAVGGAMLAQAGHTPPQNVAVQPSVPPSPLPHVQVIQQPLQNQYLQHLYAPQQQHMFLPGNLTIQPAIQGLSAAQGLSLQLQGKTIDNKTGGQTILSASPMQSAGNFSASNLMPAGSQMISAGAKTCVQGQMLTTSSKSTAVLQGQSAFIPSTTANQTVVIGQLGVLANQPSILSHQAKAMADSQNKKSFLISQPATLHPKSPIMSQPNAACGATSQMVVNNQLKQIPSAPHIVSSQAPTMIASQAQILGSLQALGASLPQGITWATPGSLHSPALFGQNPIFIRSQQSDMYIQTPPPQATIHAVPVAAATAPTHHTAPTATAASPAAVAVAGAAVSVPVPPPTPTPLPPPLPPSQTTLAPTPKLKQVRLASSVATQTTVTTATSTSPHSSYTKTQAKQRLRIQPFRTSPIGAQPPITQHHTTATQTQTQPPPSHKADAANQTRPTHEIPRQPLFQTKSASTDTSFPVVEPKPEKFVAMQEVHPTISSPMSIIANVVAASTINIALASEPPSELDEACTDIEEPSIELPKLHMEVQKDKKRENDMIVAVAPLPETIKEPAKQPQKAIVKPHVLTHIIEGFVIQEGSEPFPVSKPLMQNSMTKQPVPEHTSVVNPIVVSAVSDVAVSKKKEKIPKIRGGPVELAKCEFCGKLGPKSKFKRSKRFCSTSCAKRYNAGCSKRHALSSDSEMKSSTSGKSAKKKKLGFKSKKSWKKSQNRSYEITNWVPPPPELPVAEEVPYVNTEERDKEEDVQEAECEASDLPVVVEASDPSISQTVEVEEIPKEMETNSLDFASKAPKKWTVTDVVDFVRNLPGCSDYADEFRSQEIDGQALLLLKEDHLMSTMSMKLGPALKVCARINSLREENTH